MSEEFSLGGSLKLRRHREDSAYMSQRDSMSGGPLESSSPETEEEDQNGYVLPGDSPERGERSVLLALLERHCNYTLASIQFHFIQVTLQLRSGSYVF